MRFEFECIETLPRLAWCAVLVRGSDVARILHGPWVETREHAFCEGAWDGPFEEGRFAEAATFMGTGGCVVDGGILFATPTHVQGRLYSARDGDRLLVSNSMVFLLALTGDALDLGYPHYYFDFLRQKRRGLTRLSEAIRTANGRHLYLHQYTNLLVRSDLTSSEKHKNFGDVPTDFADYRFLLRSTMERVFANAAHASRVRRYRPLATLSQGYDAPAVAALAAELGCRVALAVISAPREGGGILERGALVGEHLGFETIEYERTAYLSRPDMPEAEFCASMAFGSNVPVVTVEKELEGSMLLTGHPGDDVWTLDARKVLPHLLAPGDQILENISIAEFQLRVGSIIFPAVWAGGAHKQALHRISASAEMRPWSVSGRYNRPIPRRIAEEAGVPRALFGQKKLATFHRNITSPEEMTAEGRSDFQSFLENRVGDALPRPDGGLMRIAALGDKAVFKCLQSMPKSLYLAGMPVALNSLRDHADPRWHSRFLYTFHWGIERIRSRYAIDRQL